MKRMLALALLAVVGLLPVAASAGDGPRHHVRQYKWHPSPPAPAFGHGHADPWRTWGHTPHRGFDGHRHGSFHGHHHAQRVWVPAAWHWNGYGWVLIPGYWTWIR